MLRNNTCIAHVDTDLGTRVQEHGALAMEVIDIVNPPLLFFCFCFQRLSGKESVSQAITAL
jgi:hypothetical protein